MTPTEIAEMQADALAGTPGEWVAETEAEPENGEPVVYVCHEGTVCSVTTVCNLEPAQIVSTEQREANARRIARVPRLEATITAQAAEIERLRDGLGTARGWLKLHAFARAEAVICSALEAKP